jgi:hypothetical protein
MISQNSLQLDPLGTRFDPAALQLELRPTPVPPTPADAGTASEVIHRGSAQLQRCYERSLKNEAEGGLTLELEIGLDAQGHVRVVRPHAEGELPAGFERCLQRAVKSWAFPAPGLGGATIKVPLKFRLRR